MVFVNIIWKLESKTLRCPLCDSAMEVQMLNCIEYADIKCPFCQNTYTYNKRKQK